MPGLNLTPAAIPTPPPPPPIVIQPEDSTEDSAPGIIPNSPIFLLENCIETTVMVGPRDVVEVHLKCKFIYHIEGYGLVAFVWEEIQVVPRPVRPVEEEMADSANGSFQGHPLEEKKRFNIVLSLQHPPVFMPCPVPSM